MRALQKIKPDNRFEKLLRKYKKPLSFGGYLVKIIGIIVILLVLLELLSFITVGSYVLFNKGISDRRSEIDVYQDEDWARDYFKELQDSFKTEYYPYVGYRRVPNYEGKYINLDNNSIRKTLFQCGNNSENPVRIFVFGGSTLWGTGARDMGTIPSFLSKTLCESGFAVEVTNFGESGYTNTQEIIKLQLELREGNIPDVVIFYDGVNDVFTSYQNGIAGYPQNVENRRKEFNTRDKFNLNGVFPNVVKVIKIFKGESLISQPLDEKLNLDTAGLYLSNIKIIKSLEDDFNFKSFFYWQPTIYTKPKLSEDEKNKIDKNDVQGESYIQVSNIVKLSKQVNDLTNIFNNQTKTIFIDWAHISEEGNSIVGGEIAIEIIRYLKEEKSIIG